jgi:hypothetical protein
VLEIACGTSTAFPDAGHEATTSSTCTWGGGVYADGESWSIPGSCNSSCTCHAGFAVCSEGSCSGDASSGADASSGSDASSVLIDANPDGASIADGAASDAFYSACFSPTGATLPSMKECASDTDCTYFGHVTNCCGATLMVGVSQSQAALVVSCEGVWDSNLVGCNNCVLSVTAEDGKSELDSGPLQVHCLVGDGGSFCETSLP